MNTLILKKYSRDVAGGDFDNRTNPEYGISFRKIEECKYGNENEFDVVTAFDVIEHVIDDESFIESLIKVVKLDGVLIIGTPNRNRFSNLVISITRGKIKYPRKIGYHYESGGDIIHLREYAEADLKELFRKFDNIEIVAIDRSFLGLYTPLGAFGFKRININFLGRYAQHLFFIVRKNAR